MPGDQKPTAVHYALILFVMLSFILGMTTYAFHRESAMNWAELVRAKKSEQEALTALKKAVDELDDLKARLKQDEKTVE